jgi:hypothetical protein
MEAREIVVYQCDGCGKLFDDEYDAASCCVDVEALDGWECGKCGDLYEDEEDAKECCREKNSDV